MNLLNTFASIAALFIGLSPTLSAQGSGKKALDPKLMPTFTSYSTANCSNSSETAVNAIIRGQIANDLLAHAKPFDGPESKDGVDAIVAAVKGKRLVGLGEGTHGTSELVRLRGNIVLSMARSGRVLVFLEDQGLTVARVNHWIAGEGADADLYSVMSGLFGVNQTIDFANFLRAARKWNHVSTNKIEIYGVDIAFWSPDNNPVVTLRTFLTAHNINLETDLLVVNNYIEDPNSVTPEVRAQFRGSAAKIQLAISGLPSTVVEQVEASVMANSLVRWSDREMATYGLFSADFVNAMEDTPANMIQNGVRDAGMAENIKILMNGKMPTSGTGVFWAHNGHIGRLSYLNADPIGLPSTCAQSGSILSAWLGDSYAPIATMTGSGTFLARVVDADGNYSPWQTVQAPTPINPNCLNAIASSVISKPIFFLTKSISFLGFTRSEFMIGAGYESQYPDHVYVATVPGMSYFAVVSFPTSSATTLTPLPKVILPISFSPQEQDRVTQPPSRSSQWLDQIPPVVRIP